MNLALIGFYASKHPVGILSFSIGMLSIPN